jgi:hypothetical protein
MFIFLYSVNNISVYNSLLINNKLTGVLSIQHLRIILCIIYDPIFLTCTPKPLLSTMCVQKAILHHGGTQASLRAYKLKQIRKTLFWL